MDDSRCREFFSQPAQPYHRQYEALRAVFLEGCSQKEVADRFGYSYNSLRQLVYEFRRRRSLYGGRFPLFRESQVGRPATNAAISPAKETDDTETPEVADRRELVLSATDPLRLKTRLAGLFLFLPLLAKLGFHKLVQKADYPGSRMVPADAALLSLLALKLVDKERRSHIDDFNFEEALGLFAGLNVLPKKSFATDYSYRTQRKHQQKLLAGWIKGISPLLFPRPIVLPGLSSHSLPRRRRGSGEPLPSVRGQAGPSIQSFFAQEQKSRVFCYANANLNARRTGGRSRCVSSTSGMV